MKELPLSLEGLKKEDIFSVSTALLYSLKDTPKYSTVSELFYLLDYDNFLKLIKYFGGIEVRIPSIEEINVLLKTLLLYQYRRVDEMDWTTACNKAGVSPEDSYSWSRRVTELEKVLNKQRIGGRNYE